MDTLDAARQRSAELEELIAKDAGRFRILTGDRPTGPLHLGHYFGSLRNRVRLQDAGVEVFVLVAGYQVLTDRDTASRLDEYVTGLVLDYLAIGIDPARTVIFAHSAVPALNPLSATADQTSRIIRAAKTDAVREISYDPRRRPEVCNLLLASLCLGRAPEEIAASVHGAAGLKQTVTEAVNELLAPVRARRAELAGDPGYVRSVLRAGNERANEIAGQTLAEVRAAMGMAY